MFGRPEGAALKIILVLLGVLVGWTVASYAFVYLIENGERALCDRANFLTPIAKCLEVRSANGF